VPEGEIGRQKPFILGIEKSLKNRSWLPRLEDDRLALAHAQRNELPEIVGRVLAARGVALEDGQSFLSPNLKQHMPDPHVMKDVEVAAKRISQAIEAGEKIAVFGDYDVDGATSSAFLKCFFDQLNQPLRIYIPDRQKEGYGPNAGAFQTLKDEGIDLVITVDCGAMAFDALNAAQDIGLEVIVADHHQMTEVIAPSAAMINPNRLDDTSGLGQLAAVGVVFFLGVALNRQLRESGWYERQEIDPPDLRELLDLVALGTICDVVPLTGINRALVKQGLKMLGARGNIGLSALADVGRITEPPGTYHAGFILGPRINAGGRVGRSDLGARILSTQDTQEAAGLAYELDRLNTERRDIEAAVQGAAMAQAEKLLAENDQQMLVVSGKDWHPGVIGIVASRLKDRFGRPCFVLSVGEDGIAKGSGRSISGVDLGGGVASAREAGLLINGGGHKMAAGVTLEAAAIDTLQELLEEKLGEDIQRARENRGFKVDGVLAVSGATRDLVEQLELVGPYGSGNPEPVFVLADVSVVRADLVGEAHVRCILAGGGKARLKGIAFGAADSDLGAALMAGDGRRLHLAGKIRADNWQGRRGVQFTIEDGANT